MRGRGSPSEIIDAKVLVGASFNYIFKGISSEDSTLEVDEVFFDNTVKYVVRNVRTFIERYIDVHHGTKPYKVGRLKVLRVNVLLENSIDEDFVAVRYLILKSVLDLLREEGVFVKNWRMVFNSSQMPTLH